MRYVLDVSAALCWVLPRPYDCLYVALAERDGCEFVTDDQKLIANLKPQFAFIVPLISLP